MILYRFEFNDDSSVDIHWSSNGKGDKPNCLPLNQGENWWTNK
jgi:hypothetical protein